MDKLINYIMFRKKTYGNIQDYASASSMYYMIGIYKVRISDHMKYGETAANECDYYFIIQPDGNYVFINGPKYNKEKKMYMKVVSYSEAKEFIKTLHDFTLKYSEMTDWFKPEGWNYQNIGKSDIKPSWDEFRDKYISNADEKTQMSIISKIESLVCGGVQKGNVNTKILNFSSVYNKLNDTQYNTLMKKLGES